MDADLPATLLRQLSEIQVRTGLPDSIPNPIKPELFAGKQETSLGVAVGLEQFGVNRVTLAPGSISSLRHWHEREDEFVLVLDGELTLVDENGEHPMPAGAFAGFPAGAANAHHLVNKSATPATFVVVGSRSPRSEITHYPDDDLGPVRT